MSNDTERLAEIEERKAEIEARNEILTAEVENSTPETLTEERSTEIQAEARGLADEAKALDVEKAEIQERMAHIETAPAVEERKMDEREVRAKNFVDTGRMEMRTILSTGNIAQPTKVGGINGLQEVPGGIVDDVKAVALTGNGTYRVAYHKTHSAAASVTEGNKIGGSSSAFDYVDITPSEWGILDAVSNQIKKYTPLDYMSVIENDALVALRTYAEGVVYTKIAASSLLDSTTFANTALDEKYLRKLLLKFIAIPGKGEVKLYLNRTDLVTLGEVRGTNEKLPLYKITFDPGTTMSGKIEEGGLAVNFRITDKLSAGTQFIGQPQTVEMPMWDQYRIETNEGGEYFDKNMIGIRGLQTANADLCAFHGFAKVTQSGVSA
jgi:hypothetical protein